jgi:hypothetical protein
VRTRLVEIVVLAALLALLITIAAMSIGGPVSTPSTYDTGPNGYQAIYDVLRNEGIPVDRFEHPFAALDPTARVVALTAIAPTDVEPIRTFLRHGGTVIAFGRLTGLPKSTRVVRFDLTAFTNRGLSAHPQRALGLYRALAGKGLVLFDEYAHGYDRTQSLWSILPPAVHAAVWLGVLAFVLALIDTNVRFAPPIVREPPADRDSSDYLRSMAALLRRARAGQAAIERFARAFPHSSELADLATVSHPSDALVLRAATIYTALRKEHA